MTEKLQVATKYLVIAQVIAVIAKSLSAQKTTPKHSDFHLHAVITERGAYHLQHHCYSLAAVLRIIRSTAAKPSQ